MNHSEFEQAIKEVLLAQSEQEMALVLARNPALLEQETLETLIAIAQKAKQDGKDGFSDALQIAVARIVTFQNQSLQPMSSIEPRVAWAIKARRHLALRKKELLDEAIAEAREQSEIVSFLTAFAERNILEVDRLAEQLIPTFQQSERNEEAFTLNLLYLDTRAVLTESYINYPFEQQKQMRELGIQACQQSIQIAQVLNDKPCQAFCSGVLAGGFAKSRQLPEAEHFYIEALEISRELAEQEPHIFNQYVANTLIGLGNVQRDTRKLAEAEKSFAEALEISRDLALQNPQFFNQSVAMTLNNLGVVQFEQQKLADAEKSFAEALQISRELAEQEPHIFNKDVAMTLNSLGNIQIKLRKFADAENSLAKALKLYQGLAMPKPHTFNQNVATTLLNLGNIQIKLRKFVDAENSYAKALQISRELAEQESHIFNKDVAGTLLNLGNLQRGLQKLAVAENSYAEALQLYQDLAEQEPHIFNKDVADTLNNLGYLQLEQNRLDEAKENFESARGLIEDLRATAITIDDRNRILQENVNVYSGLLACYIRMKDWKKALEIAELGKSRSLSDLLNLKSEDLQPKASTSDTLAVVKDLGNKYSDAIKELQRLESYERYLREQLNQFENDIRRIKDDDENDDDTRQASLRQIAEQKQPLEQEKQKVQNQRFAKQDELKSVLDEIGKYDKDFPPKAKDIDVESIFAISEKQNRTIVMFRILRESTAVIFVFPSGELHIEEIKGFGQNEMFELFRDNWLIPYLQWKNEEIGIGNWKAAIEQTLETVYEKLLIHAHRVLKEKSDCKEVLFVPNQSLALLPLHAASWKDEAGKKHYLLEEYSISYAPSVSVFKRCQENEKLRSNKTLFVTNPKEDLDASEKEVEFIERLHQPSKNLLRKDATKSAVIEALREDYGFTHFSCHGFYNQASPFDSGLVMSDEAIKLSEIISTNLQSNWLTTLSACETGMVDFASPTDEHFGLPLGFIFAGSPSVWASLWSVSDMATSELMQMAYKNLSQEEYKNNKPEALRQAQLAMLKDYPHPFFWAGFQHFGV